jgi:hypothetical protein
VSAPQHAAPGTGPKVPAFLVPLLPYAKSLVAAVLGAVAAVVVPLVENGHLSLATLPTALGTAAVAGAGVWWTKNQAAVEKVVLGEFNQPGQPATAADPAPPAATPPAA